MNEQQHLYFLYFVVFCAYGREGEIKLIITLNKRSALLMHEGAGERDEKAHKAETFFFLLPFVSRASVSFSPTSARKIEKK
jgi:hypothetical protein